ncbi:MAG: hypothetical protein KIT09_32105 [Bryobacteraceae bacterium]|nr:hypothetical protein [Bryobacteraceae bacterium]
MAAGLSHAQYRGRGAGARTYGSPSGFGNILFPGTGAAPPMTHNPFLVPGPTFAQRLGATVGGGGVLPTGRPPRDPGRGFGAGYAYPVPIFVGGYGYGYDYAPPQQPPQVVINQPPPQQTPVIINQYYSSDGPRTEPSQDGVPGGVRTYQAPIPSNPEGDRQGYTPVSEQKPTLYLIAFKEGAIHASLAYWVEGDTLHYITAQGSHNRASLELIDRGLSEQLNRERNIEFNLAIGR